MFGGYGSQSALPKVAMVILSGWLAGCSILPQSGPNMRDAEETAAERNIHFTTLTTESVVPYMAAARTDRPLAHRIDSGKVRLELGPGDVLRVQMFETSAAGTLFSGTTGAGVLDQVVIDERGRINLPYAGRLQAAGMTPAQLQTKIAARLAEIAVEPAAFVQVVQDHSNSVMVTGTVPEAGRMSLRDGVASALDALNNAGGITGEPWHYDLVLRRDLSVSRYTVSDLQNGGDFPLKPGDRLMFEHNPKKFVALGALQSAGAFDFPAPELNLLEALAAAKGLTDSRADRTGVYVFRPAESVEAKPALFLLDMSEPDSVFVANAFAMKPGDAVYVANAPLTDFMKIVDPILRAVAIFNFSTTVGQ